jgi:hypothetical protein
VQIQSQAVDGCRFLRVSDWWSQLVKTICCCFVTAFAIAICPELRADWSSAVAASDPFNWYRFDELAGSVALDYGSENRDGTYGSGALDASRGIAGLVGAATQFGNQSTVFLSAPEIVGDWSAEFLLMRTGSKRSSVLIRGIPFAFPSQALKLEQFNDTHQVGYRKFGIIDAVFSPPVASQINEWIHLTYVNLAAADRVSLYVNGALAATRIDHFDLSRDQIGSWSDTIPESPLAVMDVAALYNRALSAVEITAHFDAIPGLPGDFNNDGAVNAADYTVWRNNLGSNVNLNGHGDETGDSAGVVDRADFDLWKLRYGESGPVASGGSSSAVPEPAAVMVALLAVVWTPTLRGFWRVGRSFNRQQAGLSL